MKKEEQILRIKELINENTLYGKLVDKELLNEGNPIKSVVQKTSSKSLIKELIGIDIDAEIKKLDDLKYSSTSSERSKMQKIMDMSEDLGKNLESINTSITKDNITNKLDPKDTNNIYNEISNVLKNNLKEVTTGIGPNQSTLLTEKVEKQINILVDQMKELNLHEFKNRFDEIPESLRNILDSLPNIRTQYTKMRPIWKLINDIPVLEWVKWYFKAITKPLKVWKTWPEAWKIYRSLLKQDADGKRRTLSKIFQAQSTIVGGKETFLTMLITVAVKDASRAFIFCDEYEKKELIDPRIENRKEAIKNVVTKEKDEKMNEQKEGEKESISKEQQGWISGGIEFLLNLFISEAGLDPIGLVSRTLQRFGVDEFKGMGLVGKQTWLECPTEEEHKELIEVVNEYLNPEQQELLKKKIGETTSNIENHFTKTTEKVKEIANGYLTENGISIEEVKNVSQDDIDDILSVHSKNNK